MTVKIEQKTVADEVESNETSDSNIKKIEYPFTMREPLPLKTIAYIVYGCQALSFFFGITAIAGVILNYLKRDEVKGTWLESHFAWQIRTFWIGLITSFIGFILIFILIGFLILAATLVWTIYRVIKGYLLLSENKLIENPRATI